VYHEKCAEQLAANPQLLRVDECLLHNVRVFLLVQNSCLKSPSFLLIQNSSLKSPSFLLIQNSCLKSVHLLSQMKDVCVYV
jgi:hypothetical protein